MDRNEKWIAGIIIAIVSILSVWGIAHVYINGLCHKVSPSFVTKVKYEPAYSTYHSNKYGGHTEWHPERFSVWFKGSTSKTHKKCECHEYVPESEYVVYKKQMLNIDQYSGGVR